jgi:hypothetical protein
MYNINVVIKPNMTIPDIILEICQKESLKVDDFFAFSCIMTNNNLKINCLETNNPFSVKSLIFNLFIQDKKDVMYVMPPLEKYIEIYKPMFFKMINQAHSYYQKLIPEKEELLSILYLTVVQLYNKGYYLHNHLIYKSFINNLNMTIRKSKYFTDIKSLDEPIHSTDGNEEILLQDIVEDTEVSKEVNQLKCYTSEDFWEDTFNLIKNTMLKEMSKLSFDRLLLQLKSKTIDQGTSRLLTKYREMFCPDYIPRPNRRKGGK